MAVIWTDEALDAFDALRLSDSVRLFDQVEAVVQRLEYNPSDHRIGARQRRLSDGWAWWVTVSDGREEWMIIWRRDSDDLQIRALERV